MKIFLLALGFSLVSAIVLARDLASLARKERARRQALGANASASRPYTNSDLDTHDTHDTRERKSDTRERSIVRLVSSRDLKKEELFWRKKRSEHDRDLARLELRIRRLESRLREHRARNNRRKTVRDDPSETLIEESLDALVEERDELSRKFRDRARRAGAFPGWIR